MKRRKKSNFSDKHAKNRKTDPNITMAVKKKAENGEITCAAAFSISDELNVSEEEIGFTADCMEIHITRCQLGLFGYRPRKKIIEPAEIVPRELEDAIREAIVNDRLSCAAAWEIANRSEIGKMKVASACEALKVKIGRCQLGAF